MKLDVREAILGATVRLLREGRAPESLTAREIAAAADVNLAMINYYFTSKEKLLYLAVGELMRGEVADWMRLRETDLPALEKLRRMLGAVCEIAVRYERYIATTIAYELTKAEIHLPQIFLPLIREVCGPARDELSVRLAAYGIVSMLQLIFLRADAFGAYAGVDVYDPDTRRSIIDMLLTTYLPKENACETLSDAL